MGKRSKVWIVLAGGEGMRLLQHRSWEPGRFEELASETATVPTDAPAETPIAALVSDAASRGLFDALILVAPPHTLTSLRRALGPAAGERLIREEPRDLLGLPTQTLPVRLAALLRR